VVTNKQRQRQIARARWERQQARRAAEAARRRKVRLLVGVLGGLVVAALLGWLVYSIVSNENAPTPQPNLPVDTSAPVTLPTEPTLRTSDAPTGATTPTQSSPSSAPTSDPAPSPSEPTYSDSTPRETRR
jgi:peptidyl-prolyl cis-trans isomerase B (cyclophilin B)